MSSIYFTEPPTKGKVLLKTTLGDIDIELWSKEAPLACRNFVQLCMEGYYDDVIFHRVVYDFIAQGGDPTGTGEGGESIYGRPFKDEFHQRLKFNRRGLVGMANAGPDDNGSQFFFTLDRADELNKKHTLFGKVTGDTVYNLVKFNEISTDLTERPTDPPYIFKTEILNNPFDDIVPRESRLKVKTETEKVQSQSKATKNFSLLSFGDEAEEDDEDVTDVNKGHKMKSSHDVLSDPKLINQPAVTSEDLSNQAKRPKLDTEVDDDDDNDDGLNQNENDEKLDMLKNQSEMIAKEIRDAKRRELLEERERKRREENIPEVVKEIREERKRYMNKKMLQPQKGKEREVAAMELLQKFGSRTKSARVDLKTDEVVDEETTEITENETDEIEDDQGKFFSSQLVFNEEKVVLAKDALNKDVDYYDIFDPRNPLNERRRQEQPNNKKTVK